MRLLSRHDLILHLHEVFKLKYVKAWCRFNAVASLTRLSLRFASYQLTSACSERFEIISLNGTISVKECRVHIKIADENGQVCACISQRLSKLCLNGEHHCFYRSNYI